MKSSSGRRRILWVESIGFLVIIVLAWLTELIRIPHVVYGESFEPNWNRAVLRTVVVLVIWVWVYHETRRLLTRLHHLEEYLLVCSWCRKIGDDGRWISMEKFFGAKFDTRTSHGMRPECAEKVRKQARPPNPVT